MGAEACDWAEANEGWELRLQGTVLGALREERVVPCAGPLHVCCVHHTSLLVPQVFWGPPGRGHFPGEGPGGQPPAAGTGGGAESYSTWENIHCLQDCREGT